MKKFFSTMIMIVMLLVCCLSFSACGEELVNVEVKFMVGSEEKTIEFVLYKHLAPESVAQFEDLAEDGYYNDLIMYKSNVQGSAIAIGQYKATADGIAYNAAYDKVATIKGEFAKGGTAGSNLLANKGAICVWRWWEESRGGLSASGYETGSLGAIMLPLSSSFNDNTNDGATLIAVMGHVADADKAEYEKLVDSASKAWAEVDEYHVFYILRGGSLDRIILTEEEYEDMVEDGVYTETKTVNNETQEFNYDIIDPIAEETADEYKLNKYKSAIISVPTKDYMISIASVTIK